MSETLRIDKWLWFARFSKTRSLAQSLCVDGRITINGETIRKSNQLVKVGDTITVLVGPTKRTVTVKALAERRGPAPEAKLLYDEPTPAEPMGIDERDVPFHRPKGQGRPTKKDRRALENLIFGEESD